MEFWGVEVKAGEPLKVTPEINKVIHLSQAVLGATKKDKGDESISIHVKVANQKHVLGHLSLNDLKQLQFDLVFEKDFELSHNWKNGNVYFSGYQSVYGAEDDSDDSEEEDIPANAVQNGKPAQKDEQAKPSTSIGNADKPESSKKPKVKVVEPSQEEDSGDDDDTDDDEEDESDEDMLEADNDDDEEDETPKKAQAQPGNKRPIESASKTPVSAKKAKAVATKPQKIGGKEAHVATPQTAKNNAKIPTKADKFKPQTPKSGGQFSCIWSFGSETALNAHSKAKHN